MPRTTKTDNSHLGAKLELRRHFLERFHSGRRAIRVFDACQGSGLIWRTLRRDYKCEYWGVDVKRRRGRVAIDSTRVLSQPGWKFDVIDVDTYGSPWRQWEALLPHVTRPLTVFLTIGLIRAAAARNVGQAFLRVVGLRFERLRLPMALAAVLWPALLNRALGLCHAYGLEPVYAVEALSATATVRYMGIRLVPKRKGKR